MGKASNVSRVTSTIFGKRESSKLAFSILLVFVIAYALIGVYNLVNKKLTSADGFTAVIFLSIILFLAKKYKISSTNALFIGLIFVPHTWGYFGGYALPLFGYHVDKAIHLITAMFFTIALSIFSVNNFGKDNLMRAIWTAFVITISFGALVEMSEYWGFVTVGFGEGYLGFGDGDNSKNFGPWEDSSLDTTFNFIGGLIGVLLSYLMLYRREDYI